MIYNIIVAQCKNTGIGYNNSIPWYIKSDLKYFKKMTIGINKNAIVMGKNTWNSLKSALPNRDNLVLSTTIKKFDYKNNNNIVKSFTNIESLLNFCNRINYNEVWIIGGAQIYDLFLQQKIITIYRIYITYIDSNYECDTFFNFTQNNDYRFMSCELMDTITNNNNKINVFNTVYQNNKF